MGCDACGPLMAAHRRTRRPARSARSSSRPAATGSTAAGDSIYLAPKGKVTFKVTSKKGTTLNFVCAVHPWMLGTIKVS